MSLLDVTTAKPNQGLIDQLETLLEDAKNGELQGVLFVVQYAGEGTTHGWSVPEGKNWYPLMLAELVMAQHNFTINLDLKEGAANSVLHTNLEQLIDPTTY